MVYLVDLVPEMMGIDTKEAVMFQRDGFLHIASESGLGLIDLGLNPAEFPSAISEKVHSYTTRKVKFKENEEKYFLSILHGENSDEFSLEKIAKIAQTLKLLPDDGMIRMVGQHSVYVSHKYGYASDGIDMVLDSASTIKKAEYLRLLRAIEKSRLPDNPPNAVVITPNLMACLPRRSRFRDYYNNSWTEERLFHHFGHSLFTSPEDTRLGKFGFYVTLNGKEIKADLEDLGNLYKPEYNLQQDIAEINGARKNIKSYLDRLNRPN